MLTKQKTFLNDEELIDYCVSRSKYSSKGYKTIVSKQDNRVHKLSFIEGGSIVFVVDHTNKVEIAYSNVKDAEFYSDIVRSKFKPKDGYLRNLEEIYSVTQSEPSIYTIQFSKN